MYVFTRFKTQTFFISYIAHMYNNNIVMFYKFEIMA